MVEILRGGALWAAFQPIVELANGARHIGFEALARVRGAWAVSNVAELFTYAARCSRLADLNLSAIACAAREARRLPADATVFVNVDPPVLETRNFATSFRAAVGDAVALDRIVIEITEHSAFVDAAAAGDAFDELRASGVRFALDDHGSSYSHLGLVDRIRPSFIKISNTFGTGAERDPSKLRMVRDILGLAREFGCRTVIEGVESQETADAALELGVELAQGYHFGRPLPVSAWWP